MQIIDYQTTQKQVTQSKYRRHMASTLTGFCLVYLPHYFTKEPADFHRELLELLENKKLQFLAIEGFRGSAKSSLAALALVLWSALEGKAHFILPINETDDVTKLTIHNIREELEHNELIKLDYGDMIVKAKSGNLTAFNEKNILLANGCRIMGRSRGQKIRGLRHKEYRPDLVIGDDIEEVDKVQKKEYRDKTENWLRGTVIPAIEELNGRLIVLGNKLHVDAIMERLKNHKMFKYRAYPLIIGEEKWENCTWKGKYPNQKSLDDQKDKVGVTMWMREYLLKVVPPDGQIVKHEWIQTYKTLPERITKTGVGVDLAISEKETADYTTMVGGVATIENGHPKIYILPNPVNKHLTFHETLQQMISLKTAYKIYSPPTFYIEDVAYQKAAIQEARRKMIIVKEMRAGSDKRARLESVASFIQNGTILFPEKGCEQLLTQMLFMGVESHDDLCLTGDTLILTNRGNIPIKDVTTNDMVMTRKGFKKVLVSGQTGFKEVITNIGITGTYNHPVITKDGIKNLIDIKVSDTLYIWNEKLFCIEEKNIIDTQIQKDDNLDVITGNMINGKNHQSHYIGKYGLIILEKYLKDFIFTIKMVIHLIMKLKILSVYMVQNISACICYNLKQLKNLKNQLKLLEYQQIYGTNQRPADFGIKKKQLNNGKIENISNENVRSVQENLKVSIKIQDSVQDYVIQKTEKKEKVYNLQVEDANEYFANGVLVHNCDAFVYLILGMVEQGLRKMEIVQIL